MLSKEELYDNQAKAELADFVKTRSVFLRENQDRIDEVRKVAQELNPTSILDVGCSWGFFMEQIIEDEKFRGNREPDIHGIDVSLTKVNVCRERKLDVFQGDIHKIPFDNKVFDMVLALEILEHIDDPQKAVNELCRVTRRYCLVSTPMSQDSVDGIYHVREFGMGSLRELFKPKMDVIDLWIKSGNNLESQHYGWMFCLAKPMEERW